MHWKTFHVSTNVQKQLLVNVYSSYGGLQMTVFTKRKDDFYAVVRANAENISTTYKFTLRC